MRTFRVLVVAALAVGGLAVLAPGASASAPAASKLAKFCKAASNISGSTSKSSDSAAAKQLAKTTRKAASLAPTSKVKSALNTMAAYYDSIGKAGNDPAKAAAALKNAAKYTKAAATFTGYYIANCSTVSS